MSDFVVRHAQPYEMSQVGALVGQVYARDTGHYDLIARRSGDGLLDKPGFNSTMCRIGVVDNAIVAQVLIEPYTLRYGTARLRVAGLRDACTHPDYRGRGYASAVLRDALAYMAEQGAHLALVDGVSNYYERFGFSSVWPHYYFEVDSAEAAALRPTLRLRSPRLEDIPQMRTLYERHWGGRVTFTRSPEIWVWRVVKADRLIQVVEDRQGRVSGYIVGDGLDDDYETEVVADSLDAALTLLGVCGRLYQQNGQVRLRWLIPPDDALVNYARQWLTVTVSARYRPSGGWMARLIDTTALVETLLPEIVAQAQVMMHDFNPHDLQFSCQPDTVQIGLRAQRSTLCQLNHQDFIQIVFGTLRPAALAARPHSRLNTQSVRLLEALFPSRIAALAGWDWF
jgi:predicted acetyltransferase